MRYVHTVVYTEAYPRRRTPRLGPLSLGVAGQAIPGAAAAPVPVPFPPLPSPPFGAHARLFGPPDRRQFFQVFLQAGFFLRGLSGAVLKDNGGGGWRWCPKIEHGGGA